MVIVCNGAFKSGSTWLYLIIAELMKLKGLSWNSDVSDRWVSKKNSSFLFTDSSVNHALQFYLKKKGHFLTKTHLLNKRSYKILAGNRSENLKVLFIKRNIGDAIVSHYNHVITQTEKDMTFDEYFRFIGRYKAKEIISFQENKNKYLPYAIELSFERLKDDFENQVSRIANYLGLDVSYDEIETLKDKTSIGTLKEKAKKGDLKQYSEDPSKASKLFRSGTVGESENFIKPQQRKELERIELGKLGLFYRLYYQVFFVWRRYLYKM